MKYRIHISGLSAKEKSNYAEIIEKLGGNFHPNMLTFTNFLVCRTVLCHKYKIAQILKSKIIHENWLIESEKNGNFMPFDDFRLRTFEGIRVGILGFGVEDFKEIVYKIFFF